ncbi:peptidase M23 [Streptomyces niveus]|uniref:peptidase M23 n=1 Tax=Streptomyces niveus TaxID=193462 RepID=UPI0036B86E60
MDARDAARAAANLGGTVFKLKAAAAAGVVFIVFLLILGVLGAGVGGKAFASSCGKRGQPGVDLDDSEGTSQAPGGKTRADQIANAKIIDSVAEDLGLSGRATLVALMTALQESTLLNIDHGHLDSIGLFQQRPSKGWGSKADIMKPRYAATMFLMGDEDGDPPGLTDIKGWSTMPLGDAAQEVQRSAYPDLYAGQEDAARQLAEEAELDLDREGTAGNEDQDDDTAGTGNEEDQGPANVAECYPEEGAAAGKPGAPFHDGDAPWPTAVKNPRSTEDAIAWAKAASGPASAAKWYRKCLIFAAQTYGWTASGVPYAIDHYNEMPASMKHDKDRNPPPGALMYWDTGQRAGHVAVYLGDGKIASNDIRRPKYIDVVPATEIETKWGATYVGWAPPYFPKGS